MPTSSDLWRRSLQRGTTVVMDRNEIEIVLPHEGFTNVARLVTGGFLARRSYPYDTIDDVQLAIELVLRSLPVRGEQVTIRLASAENALTVSIGAIEAEPARQALHEVMRDGLELGTLLERLVDSVELVTAGSPALVLRKTNEAVAA